MFACSPLHDITERYLNNNGSGNKKKTNIVLCVNVFIVILQNCVEVNEDNYHVFSFILRSQISLPVYDMMLNLTRRTN